MIDSYFRKPYQTWFVNPIIQPLIALKIRPKSITCTAFFLGLAASFILIAKHPLVAFTLFLSSGYLDTLDGTLARALQQSTQKGALVDIVSDRLVEFSMIVAFFLLDTSRGLICILMLGSILIWVTTFLMVGIFTENQTDKSFYYSPGIVERSEVFIFFTLMILLPAFFVPLGLLFTLLTSLTSLIRIYKFRNTF